MTAGTRTRHLTIAEFADQQGVKITTVYSWISRGTAPRSIGRGTGRRFRQADIEAWEESRLSPAPARMRRAQPASSAA